MNILFLTPVNIKSIDDIGHYEDFLRTFVKHGHQVCVASATERKYGIDTAREDFERCSILHIKTGNIQKTNLIEKGLSTLALEQQYINAIKKYFGNIKFDLVMYSTPPITFARVVAYIKKRDGAGSYLLLKDIFPQNSIDLGMLKKNGIKGIIYKYFRNKEKQLYNLSDRIGCMSEANIRYLKKQDPWIDPDIIEVCPNSEEPRFLNLSEEEKKEIKSKYHIPEDKTIFMYGGNLGRPQCVPHIVECLKACERDIKEAFFVIVGNGTDKAYLKRYINRDDPQNVLLLDALPKDEFEKLTAACDVGLIFLDYHFNIPNFPSRILTYMQAGIPIICCTDPNTDVGDVCENNGFGWKCLSDDVYEFEIKVKLSVTADKAEMGKRAQDYFLAHYTSEQAYNIIMK